MREVNHNFDDRESDKKQEKSRLSARISGYRELSMYKDAIDECKKLIRLDPNDPYPFIDLGVNCEENGQIEKAIKYYRYAIRKFPSHSHCLSRLYTNLGYCFDKYKKRYDIAMVCYEKALELEPNNQWALNNIGAILKQEGKWKETLFYYKKAYEASKEADDPEQDNSKIVHNLAWAHYHCKNYTEAWRLYNKLVEEYPDNAVMHGDFGCVNYKICSYELALNLFEKSLAIRPNSRHYRRLFHLASKKING